MPLQMRAEGVADHERAREDREGRRGGRERGCGDKERQSVRRESMESERLESARGEGEEGEER